MNRINDPLDDLSRRATALPLKLHKENQELRQELVKLYAREEKLLKLLHKGDLQLQGSEGLGHTENTVNELENLRKRYDALKKSKLGRMQLWYWRRQAGK